MLKPGSPMLIGMINGMVAACSSMSPTLFRDLIVVEESGQK